MTRALRFAAAGLLVLGLTAIGVLKSGWMAETDALERETAAPWLPPIGLIEKVVCDGNRDFRLLFIGDVHGQYQELMRLIEDEAGGLDDETTVVLLGDMVSKGPDSDKVADFVLQNRDRVKFVFGNHELATLFAYVNPELNCKPLEKVQERLLPLRFSDTKELFFPRDLSKVKKSHSSLAKQLGFDVLKRLALHGSLALRFELPTKQTLYAVHAGMLPGDFADTTPSVHSLTEMKFVDPANWKRTSKSKFPGAERWYKLWDRSSPKRTTVLYGHDARSGLNLRDRTKGLDSACVKGGKLTALEYTYSHKKGEVTTRLLQTKCVQD
ncbi:hypothetical protein HG536_0D00460 [Torulaspora globosa]|uniref:Calcineurin-like phosphoesterase domain-containing protein n=1 Tax=Torulaspora globosa TaxID=48254 RepID=A0A7G3ZG88_9SACH|nr:uncharacterized protein HG536_0D00460 [Torulaspora globosa]QLL32524.1 hypothetical protein HG536_0D00460 [Torulaspora globosa]